MVNFGIIIYILPLTGKSEQQRFTVQSGVLASISSRQRSAISDSPLPERTDFGPAVCSYRQTHLSMPQPAIVCVFKQLWIDPVLVQSILYFRFFDGRRASHICFYVLYVSLLANRLPFFNKLELS